ncbi:PEP-CTERM sorting domain-containing protein [Sphingomonas sp. CFBP 8760]|nr:PEP-CTERM sorting domain-containing protein [Sphingomonas sp. CFBP 8760]
MTDAFEVANFTVTAVPEPATWGMMLLGFGMVAGAARYRRRSTKVVYA